jgi:uncharacterized protein YrzB (UPF0473 family)
MFDDENEDEILEIVTLRDEMGKSYRFQVIDEVEMDGNNYLITIPEGEEDQEKLIVILDEEDNLTIVYDEEILEQLQKHLEQLTIDEEIESITLLGNDGKRYEYHVVDRIELSGENYILAVDINGKDDDYIVFQVKNNELVMVEDEEKLAQLLQYFNQEETFDENNVVTLEDENGNIFDFNIMGKLEIKGNEYLIAMSTGENNELIAISVDNFDMNLVNDPNIMNEINYYLNNLKKAIKYQPHSSPECN